jgi:hypothetical protein
VGDAHAYVFDPEFVGDSSDLTDNSDLGLAGGIVDDFYVRPGDLTPPACSYQLENGFLGGETAGQFLDFILVCFGVASVSFALSVDNPRGLCRVRQFPSIGPDRA